MKNVSATAHYYHNFNDYPSHDVVHNNERCFLPADIGGCRSTSKRWFYQPDTGKCHAFYYRGCRGNANNFFSEKQCYLACVGQYLENCYRNALLVVVVVVVVVDVLVVDVLVVDVVIDIAVVIDAVDVDVVVVVVVDVVDFVVLCWWGYY